MKSVCFVILTIGFHLSSLAQFVATMEVTEPIEGLCNEKEVYAIFPMFEGQDEAVCPVLKKEIIHRLNTEITFLKENPKYKDKGMIGLVINCKGEVVQCQMDNIAKSPELDQQIENIFNNLGEWKPAKLNGKKVDSSQLFSFTIKKGEFSLD